MAELPKIVSFIKEGLLENTEDFYVLELAPTAEEKLLLEFLQSMDCVEEISTNNSVIGADEITVGTKIKVDVVKHGLQRLGYYHDLSGFINTNGLSAPQEFYISELDYLHETSSENREVQAYFALINLIAALVPLAMFYAKEEDKLYLMQDKSAVALPVGFDKTLIERDHPHLGNIEAFIRDLGGVSEKKKIYFKELIDFLNAESDEEKRLAVLFGNFDEFYEKCETAYAFFLSDFSYSKLKLELESAILDYSKNIRAIINDSQTKLVAIPAAFIIASSQLDLNAAVSLKNALIVISSFCFSLLIEIFIRNQESAVRIFVDNVKSYKATFQHKNTTIEPREMNNLKSMIGKSFEAIDDELIKQRKRLNLIRCINWGISAFLILIIFGIVISNFFEGLPVLAGLFFISALKCKCLL